MRRQPIIVSVGLSTLFVHSQLLAQSESPAIDAKPMAISVKPSAVTIYRGRASVTRSASIDLTPGLYDLQFANLPETVQPQTLQARASGGGTAKVLGVEFEQSQAAAAITPEIAALDGKIEKVQQSLASIAGQREVLKSQEEFIAAVTVKAASDASKDGGTKNLDLDVVRQQISFIAEERGKLLEKRGQLDQQQKDTEKELKVLQDQRNAKASAANILRTAIVSVVATEAGKATLDLTYLVANASWEPTYNIRAGVDGSATQVEYNALLVQRTGEDWDDVKLTLSTAQPAVAANPPVITPWFVDLMSQEVEKRKALASEEGKFREGASARLRDAAPAPMEAQDVDKFAGLAADAQVGGGGPSVTYQLPRAVTVKTNSQKRQTTRIAGIDAHPRFIHVAVPGLTDAVYIRGDLSNASNYHLLPGQAAVFMNQDYIGPTAMPSVAPNGEFKIHFGIDPSVKTRRQLLTKNTSNTGLLSGGRKTIYDYRITIDNGSGKNLQVELWDRYPVSRNEQIQVELSDLSDGLATDTEYTASQQPQGLLKWVLEVPANATGKSARVLTYGVRINRAKDVEISPLPE